jgi:hypothetical protein
MISKSWHRFRFYDIWLYNLISQMRGYPTRKQNTGEAILQILSIYKVVLSISV